MPIQSAPSRSSWIAKTVLSLRLLGVLRVMFVVRKRLRLAIKAIEPTAGGAYPEYTRLVLKNSIDNALTQAEGVLGVVPVVGKTSLPVL